MLKVLQWFVQSKLPVTVTCGISSSTILVVMLPVKLVLKLMVLSISLPSGMVTSSSLMKWTVPSVVHSLLLVQVVFATSLMMVNISTVLMLQIKSGRWISLDRLS